MPPRGGNNRAACAGDAVWVKTRPDPADAGFMNVPPGITRPAPMSNRERQRRFVERHPHYYRDLRRKETARIKANLAAQAAAKAQALEAAPAPSAPVQLALPAPRQTSAPFVTVQLPLFADDTPQPVPAPTPPAAQAPAQATRFPLPERCAA